MKRKIVFLAALFLTATYAESGWADPVYRCQGDQGEPLFSAHPCQSVASGKTAGYAPHQQRLEQVKREIVQVKQRRMNVDREYGLLVVPANDKQKAELNSWRTRQLELLDAEQSALTERLTQLVGQSFESFLEG